VQHPDESALAEPQSDAEIRGVEEQGSGRPATRPVEIEVAGTESIRDPYAIPYLQILELRDAARGPTIHSLVSGRRELRLDTDNIQRLRITRDQLPIPRDRSVVLRIDGQNFEWTSRSASIELERDRNGFWNVSGRAPEIP
jgi:hypothetical protein